MPGYTNPTREVRCELLTTSGWVDGHVVLAEGHALREHVEGAHDYLMVRHAAIPLYARRIPFFALHTSATIAILPEAGADRLEGVPLEEGVSHLATCLLSKGVVEGHIILKPGARLSDHLQHRPGFLLLRECTLHRLAADGQTVITQVPVVLLNAHHVVGVTEPEA